MLRKLHNVLPPRGIHDIHLNQGTSLTMSQAKINGIYQDGALLIEPNSACSAFFFMFITQTLDTYSSGDPLINN
jgi:uncharacterized protein YukJ